MKELQNKNARNEGETRLFALRGSVRASLSGGGMLNQVQKFVLWKEFVPNFVIS